MTTTLENPPDAFFEMLRERHIELDEGDVSRLAQFLGLLLEANTRFNLTSVTDPAELWTRHVADSLSLVPPIASAEATKILDVGSGGGFPGVPLAIALPVCRFTLLETTGKKARFLEETVAALELKNVQVVNDRAESAAHDREHHRAVYDIVVARAVGRMPVLLELTVPFAKIGGFVLAIKGGQAEQEVEASKQALHLLHASVVDSVRTPTGTVVVIEKLRDTPRMYPRRPGEPKRAPLGASD